METDADSQSNIMQSLANFADEGEEKLWEPEDSRTPQEKTWNQLTWTQWLAETELTTREPT